MGCLDHICSHMDQNRDTIYIARHRGTDLYKIGLTSSRRGLDRLTEQNLELDVVIYAQLRWSAEDLERRLLQLGEPGTAREIRILRKGDVEKALFLVSQKILEVQEAA